MNRRSFLTMLGLAPIAAPLIAKAGIENAPLLLNRVSDGTIVSFGTSGTSQGIISVAGETVSYSEISTAGSTIIEAPFGLYLTQYGNRAVEAVEDA